MSGSLQQSLIEGWGWSGLDPDECLLVSCLGDIAVADAEGGVWLVRPSDPSVTRIAADRKSFARLQEDEAFRRDWDATTLVTALVDEFGPLQKGCCYAMVRFAILGGEYNASNYAICPLADYLMLAGRVAGQIEGLPDGTVVTLEVKQG